MTGFKHGGRVIVPGLLEFTGFIQSIIMRKVSIGFIQSIIMRSVSIGLIQSVMGSVSIRYIQSIMRSVSDAGLYNISVMYICFGS